MRRNVPEALSAAGRLAVLFCICSAAAAQNCTDAIGEASCKAHMKQYKGKGGCDYVPSADEVTNHHAGSKLSHYCQKTCSACSVKCVDDDVAMKGYTGMTCTAIKAAGACAQITGNAQLKAIGAHTKCGCSCPVAAAATTAAPTAKCVDHDHDMLTYTYMNCKKIKSYGVCPNVKSDPRLLAFGANEYCGCSCELKVHTVDLPW